MRPLRLLPFAYVIASAAAAPTWVCTTLDSPWHRQHAPEAVADPADALANIVVNPAADGQRIDGFGGCFNEFGCQASAGLDAPARSAVMALLFGDGDDAAGFT